MNGYLAVTNEKWYTSIKKTNPCTCVFWRKKASFKAICPDEPFFFAGKRTDEGDRYIIGQASFVKFEIINAKKAWKKYGKKLGSATEKEFLALVENIYKDTDIDLGCIILAAPYFARKPITLSSLGIAFSSYIVSGRIVNENECNILKNAIKEE